jgi:uncharacterized protein (UPF0548 family)
MQLYFTDQQNNLDRHLRKLILQPVMRYNQAQLNEQVTTIELERIISLQDVNFDILFRYKIFPEYIMTYQTQWHVEGRSMQPGDTIVQQVYIPPTKGLSLKLIFGVRIHSIIREATRIGFSYETLQGHAERGISTFTIERGNNSKLIFKIHTYSEPGNMLSKLLAPLFSLPYQVYCTREALKNVQRQLQK